MRTSEETSEVLWFEKDKVLDVVITPAIRTRYQAFLDFGGSLCYVEYVTKPNFEIKLKQTV